MEDRDSYLNSRDNVLNRSWVTELWMRVIQKAIEDLALFTRMCEDGETLSEEDLYYANTAYSFLFDPEYTIEIGNMEVTTKELISFWGCEDIDGWREKKKIEIRDKVISKRKVVETRRSRTQGDDDE